MSNAINYLSIAKKAGALDVGETNSGAVVRAGKARILILAADASDNAKHRAEGFVRETNTPLIAVPFSKAELSAATGVGGCSMAALTDVGLASAFMSALAENEPSFKNIAELLAQKNEKALMRQREAQAHERNKRTGKAASSARLGKRRKK